MQRGLSPSPLAQVVPDDGLVEALAFVEELGDVFRSVLEQVVLQQELDSLQERETRQKTRARSSQRRVETTEFFLLLYFIQTNK